MDQFLKALLNRRTRVQSRIDDEQARPVPDQLRPSELKRLRLRYRDQIEYIERIDRYGATFPVQVVRRRLLRPALSGKA